MTINVFLFIEILWNNSPSSRTERSSFNSNITAVVQVAVYVQHCETPCQWHHNGKGSPQNPYHGIWFARNLWKTHENINDRLKNEIRWADRQLRMGIRWRRTWLFSSTRRWLCNLLRYRLLLKFIYLLYIAHIYWYLYICYICELWTEDTRDITEMTGSTRPVIIDWLLIWQQTLFTIAWIYLKRPQRTLRRFL